MKQLVVCPVPGCEAPLTTVARTKRRDGLRHLKDSGGHSRESLDHANGCAAIHDWLSTKYPNSTVRREEYSSPLGERRADVLITGRKNDRIAFEVQYSAITPAHWLERHESYRSQGIIDVWLWGHRGSNLNAVDLDRVSLTPAQQALVQESMPLLFINPEQRAIAIGTELEEWLSDTDEWGSRDVTVPASSQYADLEVHRLESFGADPKAGITSPRLEELFQTRDRLQLHNSQVIANRAAAAARAKTLRLERERTWKLKRAPEQQRIRELLGRDQRWNRSEAHSAIVDYFNAYLRDRILSYQGDTAGNFWLTQWQCVVYFDLIAGQSNIFGVFDAKRAIQSRGVNMGQPDALKIIARYLHYLADNGYLQRVTGARGYYDFKPTEGGAWW
ncbi:competence protein CoiA family protein [Demequina aurantiaca]|uniref:competence protein CoiA family protein n=1 Tax=Demequina aurantiaca TaxID=676200 RepID=UPI003D351655